jgi:hypothetical protein
VRIISNKNRVTGIILIALGLLFFVWSKFPLVNFSEMFSIYWPSLTILLIGILLHLFYLLTDWKSKVYLLIPGGILVTLGILFQIAEYNNIWQYVWPGFIIAPAIGLAEYYFVGGRHKWTLIPIGALIVISSITFLVFSVGNLMNHLAVKWVLAIIFILVGLYMLLGGKQRRNNN